MKFRRTVSTVFASAMLVMAVLLAVLFFHASAYGLDKVREMVGSIIPHGDSGLCLTFDSMDSTLMKGIRIRGVHVRSDDGTEALGVGQIDVSLNLMRLVMAALGAGNGRAEISVSGVSVLLNDSTARRIQTLVSGGEGSDGETVREKDSSGSGGNPPFGSIDISATVSDISVRVDYNGIKAQSSGINAAAELSKGLVLKSAALNVPSIGASFNGSDPMTVNDIRVSVGEDLVAFLSISDASYGDLARLSSGSAIATVREGVVSAAMYVAKASLDEKDIGLEALVSGTTVNADYNTESGELSFTIDIQSTSGSAEQADMDFSVRNLAVSGSFDGSEGVMGSIMSDAIDASVSDYSLFSRGISGELSLNISNMNSLGQISLVGSRITGLENSGFKVLTLPSVTVDYSYTDSSIGARVRSSVSGEMKNPLVGKFSFGLDANASFNGDFSIESADIDVNDIKMAALSRSASVSMGVSEKGELRGEIRSSNDLSAFFGFSDGQLSFNMFLSNLLPFEYKGLYDTVLSPLGFVSEKTAVNGNVIASARLDDGFSAFVSTVLRGKPENIPEKLDILQIVRSGRISVNTAVRDVKAGDSSISGAVSFESTLDDGTASIGTLAVTTEGLRLSYEGTIELAEMIPDGRLSLQKAEDGSVLVQILFSHEKGQRTYDFSLSSPLAEDSSLYGSVNWQNLNSIEADMNVRTSILGSEALPLRALVSVSPLSLSLQGEQIDLKAGIDNGLVVLEGEIKHLLLYPSDSMKINIDTVLKGSFNTATSDYKLSLTGFSAQMSNNLGLGFDLDFTNSSLSIDKAVLRTATGTHYLDGSFDFRFNDFSSVLNLDTKQWDCSMDFTSGTGLSRIHASVMDNQFYLDLRYNENTDGGLDVGFSVLGQRDSAFYAKADVSWGSSNRFDFNFIYDDLVVTFYDSNGHMGSLQVNDINLVADFAQMILDGSLKFRNENLFSTGETVVQSANLTVKSKVESLSDSITQILFGQDYSVDFTMGISDISLADGFSAEDTTIDINLSNGKLKMSGNMLNGDIDLESGYVDIEMNRDFLFGFKAKGYVGNDLDVLVSDINFPLPILNQLINSPSFGFRDGLIHGDILVKGTLSNPSFYGMAYCQSYEMTLFYLPNQILSVKNVVVALNNHVLSISRTPMSGYSEADGRYYYGVVSAEAVIQQGAFESFDVKVNIDKSTPLDFWYPNVSGFEMDVRGDVTGYIEYGIFPAANKLIADIDVSNTVISFKIEDEIPKWYYSEGEGGTPMELEVNLRTGNNIEFYYPEKDNSFINFTLAEDRNFKLLIEDGVFKMDGSAAIKTGQVYYFQNDFIIREGSADFTERKYSGSESAFPLVLNFRAEITDYDSDGNKVVISLILQNSTLDNINPRFSSTPMKTENEILAMLGQSVLSSSALDQNISLSSIASLAATATDALTRVGILESNKSYSISGIVRNSLGLDIFSARSNILPNVLIDALPGDFTKKGEVSMLTRYLDGTSIFAGKYLTTDWFFKVRLMLKAENNVNNTNDFGHFLAKDLILDTEVSLDWDTPMGTVSIFTNPHELSVFDILDTIGFSVTKQFQF